MEKPRFCNYCYRLEFGRGSALDGLETIRIDPAGRVALHRMKSERRADAVVQSWETATLQLSPEVRAGVLKAVEANDLMGLGKAYHADVRDGTQWVLCIRQGDREKAVFFDNSFPRQITAFAEQLDDFLARAGSDTVAWKPVPESEARLHERELWDSLKR
jgi:hypothetical protein